jgi:hypothetical protein
MSKLRKNPVKGLTPSFKLHSYQTDTVVRHPVRIILTWLAGNYRPIPKVHFLVPAWAVGLAVGLGLGFFAAATSFTRYNDILPDNFFGIDGGKIAWVATCSVAAFIYVYSNYVAGFAASLLTAIETKKAIGLVARDFLITASLIALFCFSVVAFWDYQMNIAGARDIGGKSVAENVTTDKSAGSRYDKMLLSTQDKINDLKGGELGYKFGWWTGNKEGKGTYSLNQSGKRYLAELEAKETQYLGLIAGAVSTNQNEVNQVNQGLTERREFAQSSLEQIAKAVYIAMFFVCLATAVFSNLINFFLDKIEGKTIHYQTKKRNGKTEAGKAENTRSDFTPEPTAENETKTAVQNERVRVEYKNRNFTAKDAKKGRNTQMTAREKKVHRAQIMRQSGKTNKQIARALKVSERTVQSYFSTTNK